MEAVFCEKVCESVSWGKGEEVDVDVSLDCDGGCWRSCNDCVHGCLEVGDEVGVVVWGSVEVNNGMDGVCFLFVGVDVDGNSCCVLDVEILESDMEVLSPVGRDGCLVVVLVPLEGEASGVAVLV